jgi:hypothetical protein
VLTQVWIDSRILATLSNWLESKGKHPRYLSEVVRQPLSTLVEFLVESGEIEMADNTMDSREMLQRKYHVKLNAGNRGYKNMQHNALLSSMKQGRMPVNIGNDLVSAKANTYVKSERDIALDEGWAEFKRQEREERSKAFKEQVAQLPVDEKGNVIVKHHYNNDYTERDRLRDLAIREKEKADALLAKVDNKNKIPSTAHRPLTDAELDERERKRAEKDAKEKAAMDAMTFNPPGSAA